MSGGEQQMVALARALMSEPRLLLVDEPSVGLAPILVSRMIAKIKELKEQRSLTVLMAEQNFNQAIKIADRAYVMVHGRDRVRGQDSRRARRQPDDQALLPRRLSSGPRRRPDTATAHLKGLSLRFGVVDLLRFDIRANILPGKSAQKDS